MELVRSGSPLSLRFIREVHDVLMHGVRGGNKRPGEFRPCDVRIGRTTESWEDSRFVPPTHTALPDILRDFERFLNVPPDLPVVAQVALAHYQFETIHPFMDGNGRVGRLLITLMLCARGCLSEPLLYLSAFFEHHDDEYRRHLLDISRNGTWGEWIRFVARGVIEQGRDAAARAARLIDLLRSYQRRVPKAIALIDELFASPYITIPTAARVLGKTYPARKAR